MKKVFCYAVVALITTMFLSIQAHANECQGFQKIRVESHHSYTVEVSGKMHIGDNGKNKAKSVILYYDDNYKTTWRTVRPGERVSFRQNNFPYFYAGIPRHNPRKAGRHRGGFKLRIQSRDGGTNKTIKLSPRACTSILR